MPRIHIRLIFFFYFFPAETVQVRGRGLHEALHRPQLPAQTRQVAHARGAGAVPQGQGPGQPRQARRLTRALHHLLPLLLALQKLGKRCGGGYGKLAGQSVVAPPGDLSDLGDLNLDLAGAAGGRDDR